MPKKPRGKNPAVVHHQKIAAAQQIREVNELQILERSGFAPDVQHAGSAAGSERLLRDQFVGKMKIEVRNQHCL